MAERPSDRVGERVAAYRKLAGMSADELANRVGTMSRSKLSNIENGRKKNISLDDLIDLAHALEIPLTALAIPLDRPFARISVGEDREVIAWELAESFHSQAQSMSRTVERDGHTVSTANMARGMSTMRIKTLNEYADLARYASYVDAVENGTEGNFSSDEERRRYVSDYRERLRALERELRDLGVDLTAEEVTDDPNGHD